jgi:hypothetical protein
VTASEPSPASGQRAAQAPGAPRVVFEAATGASLAWALAALDAPEIASAFGAPRSLGLATLLDRQVDAGPRILVASLEDGRPFALALAYGLGDGRIELALAIPDPSLRRRGLGLACADALLALVFDVWRAEALVLRVHRDNDACRGLLARFGPLEVVSHVGAFALYVVPTGARGGLARGAG